MLSSLVTKAFPNAGLFVIRAGLGILFVLHGWPKIAGGAVMWEKIGGAMAVLGITFAPVFWGFMAAFAETAGAVFLAAGFFTRLSAGMLAFTMFIATLMHYTNGDDFMSVTSRPLELMFVFIGLTLTGAGSWSFDHKLQSKK